MLDLFLPDSQSVPAANATPSVAEDEQLAEQARHNPDAFAELYRRHLNRVYRYLVSQVGNVPDAQDLTSQTFLAALESIQKYQGKGAFAAWLLGIAKRKVADHFRSGRETVPLDAAENLPHQALSPEAAAERHLELEQVAHGMRRLSPDRAEALALRIFGGLSALETGQVMGKSEDAVNTLVHRAMRDLRQWLASE